MHERNVTTDTCVSHGEDATTAVLVGSAIFFSDQMMRVLKAEFADVQFLRFANRTDAAQLACSSRLVVLHEAVPRLEEGIRLIRQSAPAAKIAVACHGCGVIRHLAAGRDAAMPPVSFLPLNVHLDVWLSVLRLLLCGEEFFPHEILRAWHATPASAPAEADHRERALAVAVALTPREMEILPLIAAGRQNKTIASDLGLSEHTVKLHTHNIFAKLRVNNRTSAAKWYHARSSAAGPAAGVEP